MRIFRFQGPIDQSNVMERLAPPSRALDHDNKLALDLGQVTWIDSAGLAGMVRLLADARRRGGEVRLMEASESVHCALRFARLDELFPISNEAAVPAEP